MDTNVATTRRWLLKNGLPLVAKCNGGFPVFSRMLFRCC